MSGSQPSEWQKGGIRYAKLKEIVPEYLAPAEVQAFFVGVKGRGGAIRLINPLSPLQREYVIATTTEGLVVLRLRRPGVFRASIKGTVLSKSKSDADVAWSDGRLVVDGETYQPIAFHREDAERVAQACSC